MYMLSYDLSDWETYINIHVKYIVHEALFHQVQGNIVLILNTYLAVQCIQNRITRSKDRGEVQLLK